MFHITVWWSIVGKLLILGSSVTSFSKDGVIYSHKCINSYILLHIIMSYIGSKKKILSLIHREYES